VRLLASIVAALAVSSAAAAQCTVDLEATPAGLSASHERQVPAPCWTDLASELRSALDGLGPDVRYTLVSGEWSRIVGTEPAASATSTFEEPVSFGASFTTTPLLITRLQRVQLIGDPECLRLIESKLALTQSGFTHQVAATSDCRLLAVAGQWLAFQVEPIVALERLDPRWLLSSNLPPNP
jgi:hypothetical protein